VRGRILLLLELTIVIVLVTITRCANYADVFVAGQINFLDPDCYARMTRARICFAHPGTVVRHHDFENYPIGTSPHTTAPLDYCIVAVAAVLSSLTRNALDLAGAVISPLIAIALGIFLCFWTRAMRLPFRWGILLLYLLSPILAHGFALGRPDHQSLVLALVAVALCAEWTLAERVSQLWSLVSGLSWGLALWVSPYEPVILFALLLSLRARHIFAHDRKVGWIAFGAVIALTLLIERRIPLSPDSATINELENWSATIGELAHVPITSTLWFQWCGWLLILTPILGWATWRNPTRFMTAFLFVTFLFTLWQARWGYFFTLFFALCLPEILRALRNPFLAWAAFAVGLFPIAQAWDRTFSEDEAIRRVENRLELIELRTVAHELDGPFIAPWWFSPALTYWSGEPGVAGSSHESIGGIIESAKFFAAENTAEAMDICLRRHAKWVVSYDAGRIAENTARILKVPISSRAMAYVLDRNASSAPSFLQLEAQTGRCKAFRLQAY
jgi:hypothetical protein